MKLEELKNWTPTDATKAVFMRDQNGHDWLVSSVGWDGTVQVTRTGTIQPEDREKWSVFVLNTNGQQS